MQGRSNQHRNTVRQAAVQTATSSCSAMNMGGSFQAWNTVFFAGAVFAVSVLLCAFFLLVGRISLISLCLGLLVLLNLLDLSNEKSKTLSLFHVR